jgi:hypothetical protein
VILHGAPDRRPFIRDLGATAKSGRKALVLAPLGAGKTHMLLALRDGLEEDSAPSVFLDLFTAASTPERLLVTLANAVTPFMDEQAPSIAGLAARGARDRHQSSSALLELLDLIGSCKPTVPFLWLLDEVTEIRSLAYFPELGEIEVPFARALHHAQGAVVTSSYLGLAASLFPDFDRVALPGLRGHDHPEVGEAVAVTNGLAATLLPLVVEMRGSRGVAPSLARLLRPGGVLELTCRRHYEVLLMRSRGYAVSKRAAEVVARARNQRLTDLFPLIGRTPGASRQYLRWLVEVGLLTQIRKRYDFADPILGLWASLYLGRGDHPTDGEIAAAVDAHLAQTAEGGPLASPHDPETDLNVPKKRVDRFEEID